MKFIDVREGDHLGKAMLLNIQAIKSYSRDGNFVQIVAIDGSTYYVTLENFKNPLEKWQEGEEAFL